MTMWVWQSVGFLGHKNIVCLFYNMVLASWTSAVLLKLPLTDFLSLKLWAGERWAIHHLDFFFRFPIGDNFKKNSFKHVLALLLCALLTQYTKFPVRWLVTLCLVMGCFISYGGKCSVADIGLFEHFTGTAQPWQYTWSTLKNKTMPVVN